MYFSSPEVQVTFIPQIDNTPARIQKWDHISEFLGAVTKQIPLTEFNQITLMGTQQVQEYVNKVISPTYSSQAT